jgi:hypothetical protein
MSIRANVLLWAQRTVARKGSPPHVILEIAPDASGEQIQEAFHKIARVSHPDLHRTGLEAEELELVTSAYAAVAGAYQQMRNACKQTTRVPMVKREDARDSPATPPDSRPVAPAAARTQTLPTTRTPPAGARTVGQRAATEPGATRARATTDSGSPLPAVHVPATPSGTAPSANAAQAMSAKALLYYRKAELCLKRGDLRGAVLQLKLACAADPNSGFLRTALAEVELEVRKTP